jgi:hypothetical protein
MIVESLFATFESDWVLGTDCSMRSVKHSVPFVR